MASEERNALAELAERMFAEIDGRRLIEPNREDYDKARRIIAELAKVEFGDDGLHENDFVADVVLANCRAIAEEGAKE